MGDQLNINKRLAVAVFVCAVLAAISNARCSAMLGPAAGGWGWLECI